MIVQYGGQTPLKLARDLEANGVPIIGTTPDMIDMAEDRERFQQLLHRLELAAAAEPHGAHRSRRDRSAAERSAIRWWCARRYVLGGRAMEIVHEQRDLERYMREAVKVSNDSPVLLDRFLNDAIEVDVDAVCDGTQVRDRRHHGAHRAGRRALGRFGVLAAAVSRCPPSIAGRAAPADRRDGARARRSSGLMNVQFAIQQTAGASSTCSRSIRARRARCPSSSKATGRAARQDRGALHGRADARASRA